VLGLAVAVSTGLWTTASYAQQRPYWSAGAPTRAQERDTLRPYGSDHQAAAGIPYSRRPPAYQPALDRPAHVTIHRGVGDYYPTLRSGQGPNANYIDPRTLCNPSRHLLRPYLR
jgi:hypothetical protein